MTDPVRVTPAAVDGLNSILDDLTAFPIRTPVDRHTIERGERDFDAFRPR